MQNSLTNVEDLWGNYEEHPASFQKCQCEMYGEALKSKSRKK